MSIQLPRSLNFITRFILPHTPRYTSLEARYTARFRFHPKGFYPDGVAMFPELTVTPVVRGAMARWRSLRAWAVFSIPIPFFSAFPRPGFLARSSVVDEESQELDLHASIRETSNTPLLQAKSYIEQLMFNPALFDPIRPPRNPIVLCHGLYGFDVLGPSAYPRLQLHYWSNVLNILRRKVGAEVIVTGVPSTGSVEYRAIKMDDFLGKNAPGRHLNFIAHSMGGLDCRHLISQIKSDSYTPVSLTTICTPHQGSPFMDWCKANIGIGALREAMDSNEPFSLPYTLKAPLLARSSTAGTPPPPGNTASDGRQPSILATLPPSITTLLLSMLDSPAYSNLTTHFCKKLFNPSTPDLPSVKYFSVAARAERLSVFHPLWLPKLILDEAEKSERRAQSFDSPGEGRCWGNDGLVSIESAKWGRFLGILEECDHWDMRGTSSFTSAWESSGRNGKGGWSEFLGWKGDRDRRRTDPNPPSNRLGVPHTTTAATAMDLGSPSAPNTLAPQTTVSVETKAEIERSAERVKLASAMEWIVDKVPGSAVSALSTLQASLPSPFSLSDPKLSQAPPTRRFDLERFYVALSRNLYDEGL